MKKTILYFTVQCLSLLAVSVNAQKNIKYIDENGTVISSKEFKKMDEKGDYLDLGTSDPNIKLVVNRKASGNIKNFETFKTSLSELNIDFTKPSIIIFHPGKDRCNSSGSATGESTKLWYDNLHLQMDKIKKATLTFAYKNKEGLEKEEGFINWQQDPGNIIEKQFFKYHYPCSSFVVISTTGDYISYFGEFSQGLVVETLKNIKD